jgi:hypothetical protein
MKLIIEKHPELTRLIDFFAEVEVMAQRMGVNIDDLNPERKVNASPLHTYFRKNSKAISRYRSDLLTNSSKQPMDNSRCCSISSLRIHKEE